MKSAATVSSAIDGKRPSPWRRLLFTLCACMLSGLLMLPGWNASYAVLFGRVLFTGLLGWLTFELLQQQPRRLPRWLARWVLQVVGVALVMPLGVWLAYVATTYGDPIPFWRDSERLSGFAEMAATGLLVAPWMAVSALLRQINGHARHQALNFELERSHLEHNALDARLRLLQAQVEPHFLFNTLANVRELVESGSPQAAEVLGSLIAYLRAAVPRLHQPTATLAHEMELVRAYLEIMHMRIPDRLQFSLHIDAEAAQLSCPSMSVLTLVENAVRHGIDPAEEGGLIEVRASVINGHCRIQVRDNGVGLQTGGDASGTGLATLRERLQLTFGNEAYLQLQKIEPHGTCAVIDYPVTGSNG